MPRARLVHRELRVPLGRPAQSGALVPQVRKERLVFKESLVPQVRKERLVFKESLVQPVQRDLLGVRVLRAPKERPVHKV